MPRRPKVALFTLGCAKNLVDSERIASILEAAGAQVVHEARGAAVAIVNTCGFIDPAKEESIDAVLELADREGLTRPRTLIVAGCLSQRYGEQLRQELPEVDAFVGTDPEATARVALEALGLAHRGACPTRARRLTPRAWSYLQISQGCDNRCAYCAIPLIRGPLRSLPADELLAEAQFLAGQGVKELNVIAQDITAYGTDTVGKPLLHVLLRDLCGIEGLEWVRLLYAHPAHFYDKLTGVMAAEQKVCPYVDLPLQHISNRILKAMGRKVTRARVERLLARLRDRIPGLTLRTTFITGLPGETEAEFEELLEFVREQRFDRVGCFAYSPEDDTPAAAMSDQVPAEVAQERRDLLMAAQADIAMDLAQARVGERTRVLIEARDDAMEDVHPARSRHEAPDVDPLIYVTSSRPLQAGDFADVEIVGAEGYDCIAVDLEGTGGREG